MLQTTVSALLVTLLWVSAIPFSALSTPSCRWPSFFSLQCVSLSKLLWVRGFDITHFSSSEPQVQMLIFLLDIFSWVRISMCPK